MKKTIRICIFLLISLTMLFTISEVYAATSNISVNNSSVTVGDTVTATVKYTAAAWDLKVSADSGLTTSSTTQYANTTDTAENESKSFTVKYTTTKAGTFYIYLTGDITDESASTAQTVNQKVKVTVKEKTTTATNDNSTTNNNTTTETPKEKSKNANLSTLGVTPKEYDFSGFSKNKTSYSVTVPYDVDSLKVLYKTADSNAKVKVTGNSGFEVGTNNKITIKVTAEAGNTKTYTIKVTKLAEEEEKPGNLINEEIDVYLTSLEIEGLELSTAFAHDTYSYTATLSDASVTELKVNAKANDEKAKIDISGNTELVEGENTVNILVTTEESDVQKVYQVVVNKEVTAITTEEPTNSTTDLIGTIKNYAIIAILVVVLVIIAVIVLIILLRRENKKLNEEDNEEEATVEEYNVYKNDENEFVNNNMEKDNFIESLYKQRNGNIDEDLTEEEKETIQEISNQTAEIFEEKVPQVEGQSVEHSHAKDYEENPLEIRRKRRSKGKHSL